MMKKVLLFIFCCIATCSIFFILKLGFFFGTIYGIFYEVDKSEIEIAVSRTLDMYGFKGDVKVTKFSKDILTSHNYKIEYDYTEVVDGKTVTVSDVMIYQPKSSKDNPKKTQEELAYDGTTKTMLQEFRGMAHELINRHPASVVNKEKVENFFKQYTNPNLEYDNNYWSVDEEAKNYKEYYDVIENNRKAGKSFQGLYDIPIDSFLEKEIIKGYVVYRDIVSEEYTKDYFEGRDGLTVFIKKGIDGAALPDGLYEVSYYYAGKGGGSYWSGARVPLKIQNHKMLYYEYPDN